MTLSLNRTCIVLNYVVSAILLYSAGLTKDHFLLPLAVVFFFQAKRHELREGE